MSLDWQTFKSCLGDDNNISISYIDDEGSEIPISCDCEFEEALRFAKLHGNYSLKLFLKSNDMKADEAFSIHTKVKKPNTNCPEKTKKKDKLKDECKGQINSEHLLSSPPVWFLHYMKKFKKKLLEEIKSTINETIQNALEKEMKQYLSKLETSDLVSRQIKKNLLSKRNIPNPLQEQVKILKKLVKTLKHIEPKTDKLDEDIKMKETTLEKRRCRYKAKAEKKNTDNLTSTKLRESSRSAIFVYQKKAMIFHTGADLMLSVPVINNGYKPLKNIKIVCSASDGVFLDKKSYDICIKPKQQIFIVISGNVPNEAGTYYLKCAMFKGMEEICEPFICTLQVFHPPNEKKDDIFSNSSNELQNLSMNIIVDSQKKIQENINEIQERLETINILRSLSCEKLSESNSNKETEIAMKDLRKGENPEETKLEFIIIEDIRENKQENGKKEINKIEEQPKAELACCFDPNINVVDQVDKDDSIAPKKMPTEENNKTLEKTKKDSDSDSELSIIWVSEEDEEDKDDIFMFVMPSDPDSGEEEPKKKEDECAKITNKVNDIMKKPTMDGLINHKQKDRALKSEKKIKKVNEDQCQSGRNRSLFVTGRKLSKIKKNKYMKSSNYHFTAASLTEPTFMVNPEILTKEKKALEENKKKSAENLHGNHLNRGKKQETAFNKVTYAVNANGLCFPVKDDSNHCDNSRTDNGKEKTQKTPRKRKTPSAPPVSEVLGDTSVNVLPDVLVNGASNMASLAINTAKSVISNLQSAFVTDGKTEVGKPAVESRHLKTTLKDNFKLFEMGFEDFDLNEKLLKLYNNDLSKVVEKLLENSKNKDFNMPDNF